MNEKPHGGEMQFGILGALQATGNDGRQFAFERRHTRLLAVLLLSPNKVVGRNQLIDAVWDDAPPATATRQLQNCISTLRQQLPSPDGARPVIAAQATGYLIQLKPEQLDAQLFQAGMAAARACEAAGDIAGATTRLRESLALWRGPALSGLSGRAIEAGSARLNEQRLAAVEDCLELELQQGRYGEAVSELVELVAGHPLRESMVGLLMRALHGAGRRSDALHVFAQLRDRLVGELGLDPGAALLDLHARLLRDELPAAETPSTGWRRPATLAEPAAAGRASLSRAANPRQLPASMRHFAGRDAELAALDRTVAEAAGGEAMISVIHGMGGIGKTALAVRWAHQVADQFPDGQLFVNLRGFDPGREPLAPAEAIREFLDAFAIPAEQTPARLDARVNLFRTLLAGRRVLIVLDNAARCGTGPSAAAGQCHVHGRRHQPQRAHRTGRPGRRTAADIGSAYCS